MHSWLQIIPSPWFPSLKTPQTPDRGCGPLSKLNGVSLIWKSLKGCQKSNSTSCLAHDRNLPLSFWKLISDMHYHFPGFPKAWQVRDGTQHTLTWSQGRKLLFLSHVDIGMTSVHQWSMSQACSSSFLLQMCPVTKAPAKEKKKNHFIHNNPKLILG